MISDFRLDGIHTCIFKGPNQNSNHLINDSCSFPLGSRKTGPIVSPELTINPDGIDVPLMLLYPDNDPFVTAKEISGECVWFALSDNHDAPDFRDHNCDVSILLCK